MGLLEEQTEERKRRILAAVRRMITDTGYEGVTIRELAKESRVSVPTLYKLFGGKRELLFAAVESHFANLLKATQSRDTGGGLERIFSLVEVQCEELCRTPRYSRSLLGVFFSTTDAQPIDLNEAIVRDLTRQFSDGLAALSYGGELATWVEPRVLAQRLAGQCHITSLAWTTEHLSDEALLPTMMYGVCMMLLGVTHGDARDQVERRAREVQDRARWHSAIRVRAAS